MKKSKLLAPALSIAGIATVTAPVMTLASCHSDPVAKEMKVELVSPLTTDVTIGDTVEKKDFKVTVKFDNGETKEVTDWQCMKIGPEGHTFTQIGEEELEFTYKSNLSQKITFTVSPSSSITFITEAMSLATGTTEDGKTYKTSAKPLVYSNGVKLRPADYTLTASDATAVTIDSTTGVVTAIKASTDPIKITATLNSTNAVTAEMSLYIKDYYYVTCKETTAAVSIKASDSIFMFDETVTVGDTTYTIDTINTASTAAEDAIHTLILPKTIKNIDDNIFSGSGSHLEDVYYLGSKDEYYDYIGYEHGTDWLNNQVVSIHCLDGDYELTRRLTAEKVEWDYTESKKIEVLSTTEPIGGVVRRNYKVRFFYSELGANRSKYTKIAALNKLTYARAPLVTINGVYADGEKLTYDTQYTLSAGGEIEFKSEYTATLANVNSIVVDITTPIFDWDNVYISAFNPADIA